MSAEPKIAAADVAPLDWPILRIEVTVAAAIELPDGSILGSNMVDGTIAFGWRADNLPLGLTDAQVNAALTNQMSPVMAILQTALVFQGWALLGQVDDPMTENARDTGLVGRTTPVTVELRMPNESAAIHD